MRRIVLSSLFTAYCLLPTAAFAQSIDLLWQGETYTPPFYEGRSLWSRESRLSVTALASVPGFSPQSLYYRWTRDGTVLGSLSGVGRSSLTFVASVLASEMEIKVDARDGEDGPVLASSTITLRPLFSRLLVVEDSPLYGLMLHKPVKSEFFLSQSEVSFSAIPLFARVTFRAAPAITYTWTTNTGDARTGNSATYRAPEGERGESVINLKAENTGIIEVPPKKSFLVKFGEQSGF